MNSVIKVALTAVGGNTVSEDRLLVVDNIVEAVADSTKVLIKYRQADGSVLDLLTGTLTLDQLSSAINDLPVPGAREFIGVIDATDGVAIGTHDVLDLAGNVIQIPDNSFVWDGFYEVTTTFTSATDAATIALGIATNDVDGLKAAAAISTGTTYDAAAPKAIIQDGTVTNQSVKTTAARNLQYAVAIEALTAGVMYVYVKVITTA